MSRIPLSLVLALSLSVPTGCITVDDHVEGDIGAGMLDSQRVRFLRSPDLEVQHLVFARSPGRNEALKELVRAGIVPAYVRIKNVGPLPVDVSEDTLRLRDKDGVMSAIRTEELPRRFQHFNGKALAANVANVVILVGGVVILACALGKGGGGGGGNWGGNWGGGGGDEEETDNTRPKPHYRFLNPLTKVTTVNYHDVLISKGSLYPGETVEGLVFFSADGRKPLWKSLHLELTPPK